jgi:hypothetical protein
MSIKIHMTVYYVFTPHKVAGRHHGFAETVGKQEPGYVE